MKTKIYLVRHIESEGNICRRSAAQFDCIVTRKGMLQKEVLADRFDNVEVDAVYSSDIYRAIVTAQSIAERKGLPIKLRRLLREYTIGNWEGYAIGDTAKKYPEIYEVWVKTPWAHNIPGADNFETVAQRGLWIIKEMAHENPGKSVVAITHTCLISCTLTLLLGLPISEYSNINGGDNTAVTLIEVDEDDTIEVKYIADISHMPENLKKSDYTGRTLETNFYYDDVNESTKSVFLEMYHAWCLKNDIRYDENTALDFMKQRLSVNPKYMMLPILMGKNCGLVCVRDDNRFPDDHGIIDLFYITDDITKNGIAAQAFGEGLDRLRRNGKRFLILRDDGDKFTTFFFERFMFEVVPEYPEYRRLAITVPGVEGPIY